MSSSDGIDVAMISSVRVAPLAARGVGSQRAAETAERAGRFTAMLESLNGVSARAANDEAEGTAAPSAARASASSSDRPVALGAVSLLALNEIGVGDGGTAANPIVASDTAVDARWLATLQNDAGEREIAAD